MKPEATPSPPTPRGQLALTRWLAGGRSPRSPGARVFPARVPRYGEALPVMALAFALASAALITVFPATFAGTNAAWLVLAAPALVQLEIVAAAALHIITAPIITGRGWFGLTQIASIAIAASNPGWPRTVAATAAIFALAEWVAARMEHPRQDLAL